MGMRTIVLIVFSFVHITVLAMEEDPAAIRNRFEARAKSWPLQDIFTLKHSTTTVESSIMFFVPKDTTQMPFIGYSSCSCDKTYGLSRDREHREVMIALFKAVLDKLASMGFKEVRFTAKLRQSPECLKGFIKLVPIIKDDGAEILIATQLP